jgi:hypothetical protein
VATLTDGLQANHLQNAEIFLFTDNSTSESAFFHGTSKSKRLFDLVLQLWRLEMHYAFKLHFIHVPGKRMIHQGTDGISCGILHEGIMQGHSMLAHVPLHLDALVRQPRLLEWLREWTEQASLSPLTPEDWYERGQGFCGGTKNLNSPWMLDPITETWLLWAPPPAAASAALDALQKSRHKRTHLNHVIIIPRLLTYMWRKRLHRMTDFVFEVPPGARPFWPSFEFEPLIVGVVLRFSFSSPWQVRKSDLLLGMDRELRELWQSAGGDERPLLRQLCQSPGVLDRL